MIRQVWVNEETFSDIIAKGRGYIKSELPLEAGQHIMMAHDCPSKQVVVFIKAADRQGAETCCLVEVEVKGAK
jgi:hypothetical protein